MSGVVAAGVILRETERSESERHRRPSRSKARVLVQERGSEKVERSQGHTTQDRI